MQGFFLNVEKIAKRFGYDTKAVGQGEGEYQKKASVLDD